MGTEQLVIVALILFFSSLTQAMIGFAFNLIAIPLLIWSGLSLAEAVGADLYTYICTAQYQSIQTTQ